MTASTLLAATVPASQLNFAPPTDRKSSLLDIIDSALFVSKRFVFSSNFLYLFLPFSLLPKPLHHFVTNQRAYFHHILYLARFDAIDDA
ncbi:MAG: hypothetical protein EOO38_08185 [Cytophagaceae bacterium]|nr:MAG: hypothetical protein EOO38_08185 [Cytophagaceae bacterium]